MGPNHYTMNNLFGKFERVSLRLKRLLPGLFLLYVSALYGLTAVLQDGLFERDGYYHARFTEMMPERWLDRAFPWTQLSTWREHFCDKEFLYHLAMMPFAQIGQDPIFGARLFTCLLSVAVVALLFWVLRTHGCRTPLLFAAATLASGGLFIARLGMIRSHVLSMALLMVGIHLLLEARWRALFVLGFIYAWSYTMPFVLLMTAVPFVVGKWARRGGLDWRSPIAAGLGSILGLMIHPYSPETWESFLTYLQVFRIGMQGAGQSGFELGNEIYPYSLPVFFDIYPLVVILVPVLLIFALWRWKKLPPETAGVFISTYFWLGMTAASARFVEYSVLLLAIATGFVLRDAQLESTKVHDYFACRPSARLMVKVLIVAALIGLHFRSMNFYTVYQTKAAPPRFFTGASQWMASHLKPGETVINLYWDDFPELFYDGSRQHYIWGLDPTYSIRQDYDKALLLETFRRHERPLDGHILSNQFDSRYLVLRASRLRFFPELEAPPFRKVYKDSAAVIFALN